MAGTAAPGRIVRCRLVNPRLLQFLVPSSDTCGGQWTRSVLGLLYVAIGIVVGVVSADSARRLALSIASRLKRATQAPADKPAGGVAAAPASDLAPPAAAPVSTRLQRLIPGLDKAVEDSAHPSDLLELEQFKYCVNVLNAADVSPDTVLQYALGTNAGLACAAFEAISKRADAPELGRRVTNAFRSLRAWQIFFAFRAFRAASPTGPIGEPLAAAPEWWVENSLTLSLIRAYLSAAAASGAVVGFGDSLGGVETERLDLLEKLLRAVDHPTARELLESLQGFRRQNINRVLLDTFGRFPDPASGAEILCAFDFLKEPLALCQATVCASPAHSIVIVGEARSGKSALVRLLTHRLGAAGYVVFEASAADIMAGQKHIGELEARLRLLVRELAIGKKVIWFAPDILQLATAGIHQGQSASILDQVRPALTSGDLVLVSEATPSQLSLLLQVRPTLRTVLQLVRLRPLSSAEIDSATRLYAERLERELGLRIPEPTVKEALHLARQYLGSQQVIGGVFDFLKLAASRAMASEQTELAADGLIDTLSQASGLPRAILDDSEAVELAALHRFFGARVMGQGAAVEVVVDRIAMLKAGLTDPSRPIAVILFAGPTGTGKTELAKTVAEYLFGATDRLIRLDMSEFQVAESTRRILGEPGDAGEGESLAQRVRKQPFCVVLLDEFEKAHANIWDLFLQVFDDGRLTDRAGQTVDFRHAFVILTTNLGATSHKGADLGFTPGTSAFSDEQVLRAVRQNFRPEFVNRLDRIIVFQPLGRELMRGILHKELSRVLERRGLKNRAWAVEWEPSAIEFLLDRGFSADMGARPLRRAIDQHLLAPLAATLVEHRFPEGEQFLFVKGDGRALQVEFVDPDDESTPPGDPSASIPGQPPVDGKRTTLPPIMLQPDGSVTERALLHARILGAQSELDSEVFNGARTEFSATMQSDGFWDRPDRFVLLARYALLDRIRVAIGAAKSLEGRLQRSVKGGSHSRIIAARLASQVYTIELGLADARLGSVADCIMTVQPAFELAGDRAHTAAWCEQLIGMYRQWAALRNMQVSEHRMDNISVLVVSGFGAWATLKAEVGLHVMDQEVADSTRVTGRVKVATDEPVGPMSPSQRMQRWAGLLAATPAGMDVVRRYRAGASPLVRDAHMGWRTGRLDLVLAGNFDLIGDSMR
jgi:ATP-dependent Clp protease ATP-binding subunit ClpC